MIPRKEYVVLRIMGKEEAKKALLELAKMPDAEDFRAKDFIVEVTYKRRDLHVCGS